MRIVMIVASAVSYFVNEAIARARTRTRRKDELPALQASLVRITSIVSMNSSRSSASDALLPSLGGDDTLWWKLSLIITCGTLAGAIIPELVKVFTSTESAHVKEVVTSSAQKEALRSASCRGSSREISALSGSASRCFS